MLYPVTLPGDRTLVPVESGSAQPNEGVKVQTVRVQSVCSLTISPRGRWVDSQNVLVCQRSVDRPHCSIRAFRRVGWLSCDTLHGSLGQLSVRWSASVDTRNAPVMIIKKVHLPRIVRQLKRLIRQPRKANIEPITQIHEFSQKPFWQV